MTKKLDTKEISGELCPLCNGRGIIFNEFEDFLIKKIELYDNNKIKRNHVTKAIYEYIFLKYGFNPTISEASQFFDISSLDTYRMFLSKLNDIGKSIINNKKTDAFFREKRLLQILSTDDKTITKESIDELIKRQDYKCAICSKSITMRGERHLDHIQPLSKGGGHTIKNVQWTCVNCNVKKSNKIIIKK